MRLRFGRLMLLCAIAVGAGALPVVLLEIGLRTLGYGYDSRFFVPLPGGPFHTANQRFGRRFFPPQLARTPAPERFLQPKPAGTYRIFILGESAAMGFPEPGFSFGRHLEMMLRRMYPARRFEAIQASMTAINSHAILPIARDCLAFQPDLFIAYAGNNEVVGPYGAGTVFTRQAGSLALVRASVWLSATRTGQLLAGLARGRDQPPDWRGMEMFLGQSVPFDNPRLQAVYANFRRNMTDLCRVMRRTGARAILSTVAVNLKDAPPFASETASARFSHAHTLLARGRTEEARREFALARDLDELRFRADSTINRIVRETASAERVPLVDAEQIFGRNGVPGDNFFYEHVHLKPSGNYLLARSLLAEVVTALRLEPAAPPDERTVASDLVRTSWDDYRSDASIAALLRRPPFSAPVATPAAPSRTSLDEARAQYSEAVRARPDDLYIRQRFADLLSVRNENAAAEEQWRQLLARIPDVDSWRLTLGSVLLAQGKLEGAFEAYQQVMRSDPLSADANFGAGTVLHRKGKSSRAAERYREALRLNPNHAEAENNLGLLCMEAGDDDGAMAHFRRAIARSPDLAGARMNLAAALQRRATALASKGELPLAAKSLEEAVRLAPDRAPLHYDWGTILNRQNRPAEAAERFAEAVRLNPSYPEAWNNLGAALARRGEMSRAAACFRKALELRPDFAAARQNLSAATGAVR